MSNKRRGGLPVRFLTPSLPYSYVIWPKTTLISAQFRSHHSQIGAWPQKPEVWVVWVKPDNGHHRIEVLRGQGAGFSWLHVFDDPRFKKGVTQRLPVERIHKLP